MIRLPNLPYAARRLRNSPGFTLTVVLSLAIGIGASAVLFSLVNAAIVRMIPVRHPSQLVWFDSGSHGRALSYPFYQHIQNDAHFDGILAAFPTVVNLSSPTTAERAEVELVSANYFEVLGLSPSLGRLLTPADDHAPVAVISHAYWQNRLGGSPSAVGQTIRINGSAWTIVGVAPPGFGGLDRAYQRVLFVPIGMKPQVTPGWNGLDKPLFAWLYIAGRLQPGVNPTALGAELNARFHAFQETFLPADPTLSAAARQLIRGRRLHLDPLGAAVFEPRVASQLSVLSWMVALLLALTCANVAGLQLSRSRERSREIATRLAIGGSRRAIIQQLLTESLLLALAGGAVALFLAATLSPLLAARFPLTGADSQLDVPLDLTVLTFTFAVSLLACLLSGLLPAWQATKIDLVSALKGAAALPSANRLRSVLLTGQVALSVCLLGAAALLAGNLRSLLTRDTGFDHQRLLMAEVEPALSGYDESARLRFYQDLQNRLDALASPATYSAAVMANVSPRSPFHWSSGFDIVGRESETGPIPRAVAVGPGYLEAMRIPLRSGRLLQDRDDAQHPRVAVITESLARRAFPHQNPLGQRFVADRRSPTQTTFEIVGVVADVNLADPRNWTQRDCVFLPYRQWAFPPQSIVLHARLAENASPAASVQAFRTALHQVDPNLALFGIRSIEQATGALLVTERLATLLTLFFASAAALLCALGIYGVVSRELATRLREIAIRLALGGKLPTILLHIAKRPVTAVLAGLCAGAVFGIALAPILKPFLGDAPPSPWLVAAAVFLLTLIASAAFALPAIRARKLEPAALLRQE